MAEIPDGRSRILLSIQSTVEIIREFENPCLVSLVADGPIGGSVRQFLKNEMCRFFRSSNDSVDFPNSKRLIKTCRHPKRDEISPEDITH